MNLVMFARTNFTHKPMRRAPAAQLTDQQRHARAGRQLPPQTPPVVGDKARHNRTASQATTSGRYLANNQIVVVGSITLATSNGIGAILQNTGGSHGPANRVKAARSMTGIPYLQQTGVALRAGTTLEALRYMDCSEFVSRVLAIDGITQGILPMNTGNIKALLSRKDLFAHSKEIPKVGDIALWEGHVGIVSEIGKNNTVKLVHAAGAGKVSLENKYAIKPSQYRSGTFYGYYRPLREDLTGISNSPPVATPIFTDLARSYPPKAQKTSARNHPAKLRSNADGSFSLDEVVVRPSASQTQFDVLNDSINLARHSPSAAKIPAPVGLPSKLPFR